MSNKTGHVPPVNPMGTVPKGRQIMQETAVEMQSRKMGNFPEIEAELPVLRSRRQSSFIDKISALLGEKNPLARPVNPRNHSLWLLDNTAYRTKNPDEWSVEVVAAYFIKGSGQDSSAAVAKISELIGLAPDDQARKRVAERLRPFLEAVLPAHTAQYEIDSQTFKLGPSSTEGLTSDIITFKSKDKIKGGVPLSPSLVGMAPEYPTTMFTAEDYGWAVISDIDDTIKKTLTSTALGVLKTTFVDDPEPIAGMPELYQHIIQEFDNPPFWYLTASPYNLYSFLRNFRDEFKFPPGQMILRDASWMSLAGLLASVTQGTQAYKVDRMKKIHKWFPKRSFIVFGDSTQSDPEAYAEIYDTFPGWIKHIFIRRVKNIDVFGELNENEKIKPERFEKAFEKVKKEDWYVYDDPKELYTKLEEVKKTTTGIFPEEADKQDN
jgi:hypothetical protein